VGENSVSQLLTRRWLMFSLCVGVLPYFVSACTLALLDFPPIYLPWTIDPIPVPIGIYYSPELRSWPEKGKVRETTIGRGSEALIDAAFRKLFVTVIPTSGRPPLSGEMARLPAVIEPSIEGAEYHHTLVTGFKVRISYAFVAYAASGERLAAWHVSGRAESKDFSKAVRLAVQEAGNNMVLGFREERDIQRWLERAALEQPQEAPSPLSGHRAKP